MIIRNMTAHFGTLNGDTLSLAPGLNVIRACNEGGKSTWCAFLRTMLYGLNTSERAKQGQHPDKVKYQPWSGTPMSGRMDVEIESGAGHVSILRWTERAGQPMQAFSAVVTGTDDPVPGLTTGSVGENLTGVCREVFERTAFIRPTSLAVKSTPELEKRLVALVCSGDEEQSFQEANQRLRAWKRRRRGSGERGAIPETEENIARAERQLESLTEAAEEAERLDAEIAAAEARQAEAVQRMEQARADTRREMLRDMTRARERLQKAQSACREAEQSCADAKAAVDESCYGDMGPEEARRLSDIDRHDADELWRIAMKLPPVWIAFVPLCLGLVAMLLAIWLPWKAQLVMIGAVGVLLFVVMYLRLLSIRRTKEETLAHRQKILDAYGVENSAQIEDRLAEYRLLWEDMKRSQYALETAQAALEAARENHREAEERLVNGLDFENGDGEAARATRAVREGQTALARLQERRTALEGRAATLGDPVVLRSEIEEGRSRLTELCAQEEALQLALETLADADLVLQERFSPLVAKKAVSYFSYLTGGRYDEITLNRDLAAKARRAGDDVEREADYLSDGAQDQMYLAIRLALCDFVLPSTCNCPIILDDALISFDQERMERALELIKAIAARRQVLLFTCHDRESAYLAGDPAVHFTHLGENQSP